MDLKYGWNFLCNTLRSFKVSEIDLWYNAKSDTFFCDYTGKVKSKVEYIYLGQWSINAKYDDFIKYNNCIKEVFMLFQLNDIPKGILSSQCNGCGSGWTAKIIPDLRFHNCCQKHDFRYYTSNDKSDKMRKWIDTLFYWDMLRVSQTWIERVIAYKFYFMVRLFGAKAFRNSSSSFKK